MGRGAIPAWDGAGPGSVPMSPALSQKAAIPPVSSSVLGSGAKV